MNSKFIQPTEACPILLQPGDNRLTAFPIGRPGIWEWYKEAKSAAWDFDEIGWNQDGEDYRTKLSPDERYFVRTILAFFAASDGIVNDNLAERFREEIPILEARYFYDFQIAMENVHAVTYSMALDSIIVNATERAQLLNAIETMPIITKISEYMKQTIASTAPFAERLLRMALVEGVLFRGAFAMIYWLQARGLMPGLGQSNKLISIDEGLHSTFAMFLYSLISPEHKLGQSRIAEIVRDFMDLACEFMAVAFTRNNVRFGLSELNYDLLCDYLKAEADNLIALIDLDPIFNTKHNLRYMDQLNMKNRTNFFERRAAEYSKKTSVDTDDGFDTNF